MDFTDEPFTSRCRDCGKEIAVPAGTEIFHKKNHMRFIRLDGCTHVVRAPEPSPVRPTPAEVAVPAEAEAVDDGNAGGSDV